MTTGQPVLNIIPQDRFVADVQALAAALEAGGWRPDFIVGIGRGGLVPATYLSHRTGIAMLSIDQSARVPGFADDLLTRLAAMSAAGRRLLLVDDINDSGGTLLHLRETLQARGGDPANARVAVLISNDRSRATVDYCARTIDRATDKRWYVFPWESLAPVAALVEEARDVPERLA